MSLFTHEQGVSAAPVAARVPGAVSIDRIVEAAPLRFVEGIAVVQALCAAVKDKGGVNAGMPNLAGIFLREGGDVVAMTPPGTEPAAPELARLLHRLVPADATPPVARLFVDRWTSGDSADLAAFASEIAYFARPNGRELLTGLYSRCAATQGIQKTAPAATPISVAPVPPRNVEKETKAEEATKPARPKVAGWLESHKRQMVTAAAVVALAVTTTALVTWFWPSKVAQAAQVATPIPDNAEATSSAGEAATSGETSAKTASARPAKPAGGRPASQSRARLDARNTARVASPELVPATATQAPVEQQLAAPPADSAPAPAVGSRVVPDMRIYTSADAGIEPPRLRSTEILEGLIAGFPTKTNSVEVFVDTAGKVERVRMQGPPQRIPDIMLLSRVKEWVFAPATKDGIAVRYRLILSWDVTP